MRGCRGSRRQSAPAAANQSFVVTPGTGTDLRPPSSSTATCDGIYKGLQLKLPFIPASVFGSIQISTVINTRLALHFGGLRGERGADRMAIESGRRRVWASRSMADNSPNPHQLSFWLSPTREGKGYIA
eukprot:1156018-Pelagomonas_calceolata.AAC.9